MIAAIVLVIVIAMAVAQIAIAAIGINTIEPAPLAKKEKIQVQTFYSTNMIIVKLENGNVEIQDNDAQGYECLQPTARLKRDDANQVIRVIYAQNNIFTINYSQVTALQVAPAAAVAFTGTLQELFDSLKTSFFFDELEKSFYEVEKVYQTVPAGITVNTVVYEYEPQDGETVGLKAENLARRGTGATGAYGEWCVRGQRIGGTVTLSTLSRSFNSSSYGAGISFAVSGIKIQVIATVSGAIAIHHKGIIRAFKM